MQKRVTLRYRSASGKTSENGIPYELYEIGESRPAYVIIARGRADPGKLAKDLGSDPRLAKELDGAPVIWLPEGAEFELWEACED